MRSHNFMKKYRHMPCVLCLIENSDTHQLLMVKNLRGMNKGFYNFAGGKMNYGEDIKASLIREVKEETNLTLLDAKFIGRIDVVPAEVNKVHADTGDVQVYVFYSNRYKGEIKAACGEVDLCWFDRDKLPFDMMRDNDKVWVPEVLKGQMVNMRFYRNDEGKLVNVIKHKADENCMDERFNYYKFMKRLIKRTAR